MSLFRRPTRVPAARVGGVATLVDLADLTDPEAVDAVLMELDELRATVYRQANQIREHEARFDDACSVARAEEHHRVLVAVAALRALADADPAIGGDVAAFAARIEAAVARLAPTS